MFSLSLSYFSCPYSFASVPLGWIEKLIVYLFSEKFTFRTEAAIYNDSPRIFGSLKLMSVDDL